MWASLGLAFSLIFLSACSVKETATVASGDRISPTYQGPPETTYCSSTISYGGATSTISGVAKYTRRNSWGNSTLGGLGSSRLGFNASTNPNNATEHAIRRAEVRVTDPSGAVVQCAETDGSGNFSFILPQGSVTYTVSVNSRANNTYLKASILNRPEQNLFYSLKTTVVPSSGAVNVGTLMATADGTVLGGAFNILDQFLDANAYLIAQVGACSGTHTGCLDVTTSVAKVVGYWELGYNPNSYFGASTSGLSFYLPSYSRLFILGGINGDVNSSDTDHFDNSVILHEYGHFLEDAVFYSDSPGGSHNGNAVIDPRLAWSEGWGNFFQAAVLTQGLYIDTTGNDDGSTDMAYYANLETGGNDTPVYAGEGNFREFSVTRLLWDAIDAAADGPTNGATDNVVSLEFDEIWASITKTTQGLRDTDYAFRSVGHLHVAHDALTGETSWSTIRTMERHDGDTSQYAEYRTTGSSCAVTSISSLTGGNPVNTHMLRDNDFYHIKIASAGSYTFYLEYDDTGGVGNLDLDLYLYNEDANFADTGDMITYGRATPTGASNQTEQFTVNLAAGNYLLNVSSYSGSPQTGTYEIRLNGAQLCPGTL
jgi:hypothetical protein